MTLSSFSQVDSVVTFALLAEDTATFYRRTGADGGLEKAGTFTQAGLRDALALSDGTAVLACAGGLVRTDGAMISLSDAEIIIGLNQTGTGVCYVDAAGLKVFYADFTDWQPYPILELEKEEYDLDACTSLWITQEGSRPAADGRQEHLLRHGFHAAGQRGADHAGQSLRRHRLALYRGGGEDRHRPPVFVPPWQPLFGGEDQAVLPDEDTVADAASTELADIRRHMRAAQAKSRQILQKIISSPSYGKILQETIITQRDGRFVVPVKAEHKGDLPGLVHDISSTGATLFVEPMGVVQANNEYIELQAKEQKEIDRILAEFSAEAAAHREDIQWDYDTLVHLDLIFARGQLSYKMNAVRPEVRRDGAIRLRKARHPLLALARSKNTGADKTAAAPVRPLDILLRPGERAWLSPAATRAARLSA